MLLGSYLFSYIQHSEIASASEAGGEIKYGHKGNTTQTVKREYIIYIKYIYNKTNMLTKWKRSCLKMKLIRQ